MAEKYWDELTPEEQYARNQTLDTCNRKCKQCVKMVKGFCSVAFPFLEG